MLYGFHWVVWVVMIGLVAMNRARLSILSRRGRALVTTAVERTGGHGSTPGGTAAMPSVTFLVPAWNAEADIEDFVRSYRSLSLASKQLILCAGGRDRTFILAQEQQSEDVLVLEQPAGMGKQKALRISYPHAVGEVIFLLDIDCRPTDDIVEGMITRLITSGAAAVTGPIRPLATQEKDSFVRAQWAVERYGAWRSPLEASGLRGNNALLRREAVDATGAFAQDAFSGTDYTLAKELLAKRLSIRYAPDLEMPSEFPEQLRVYCRKQARWIRNVYVLGKKYGYQQERRSVQVTIAIPVVYCLLLLGGIFAPDVLSALLFLVVNAWLNRETYCRSVRIAAGLRGTARHMLGDLGAGMLVVYQVATQRFTW